MRVRGTPDLPLKQIGVIGVLPGQREWSRPKHDMTEGIMTLAEDIVRGYPLAEVLVLIELRDIHTGSIIPEYITPIPRKSQVSTYEP